MQRLTLIFLTTVLVALFQPAHAQSVQLPVHKKASPDRMHYRHFGHDVAKDDDYVVVSQPSGYHIPFGSGIAPGAGRVYVYQQSADTLALAQTLWASDSTNQDNFGVTVAVQYPYIIIGANTSGLDANGGNFLQAAGAAYVFTHNTSTNQWTQTQKLVASDRHYLGTFGTEVYLRDSMLVIGAYNSQATDTAGTTHATGGAIYTFELTPSGTWSEVQKFSPPDVAAGDQFGFPITPTDDGGIMVGATYEDHDASGLNYVAQAGSVYLLEPNGSGGWQQQQKIVANVRPSTE